MLNVKNFLDDVLILHITTFFLLKNSMFFYNQIVYQFSI